jgi:F0F1-type ATP synthase membrane subunit b/b'
MARREAAYELRQAIRPLKPEFELGAFLWAFLIYGAVVEAVRLGWKPRPETEAERKRRIAADAAAARKAKREAEKKAAEAKAKEEARKGRGAIIPFLKSAER